MAKMLMQIEASKLRELLFVAEAALSYFEEREDFRLQDDGTHLANEEGQLAAFLRQALDEVGEGLPESWQPRPRPQERSTICQMPSATDWPKGEEK